MPTEEERKRVLQITGQFVDGKLNGVVTITFVDASYIEGFVVDNIFHGAVRRFETSQGKGGRRKRYNSVALETKMRREQNSLTGSGASTVSELTSIGIFKNGKQQGPMWKFLAGGSFLFGQVSTDDAMLYKRFSTENGAYINADFATGYVGVFDDGRMVTSQQSTVDGQTEIDQVSNL